jgi:hypothetical protein
VLCNNDVKSFALLNLFNIANSYCANLEDVVPRFRDRSEVCLVMSIRASTSSNYELFIVATIDMDALQQLACCIKQLSIIKGCFNIA